MIRPVGQDAGRRSGEGAEQARAWPSARCLGPRVRRFLRGGRGSATVEFVIVFPLFLTLLCSTAESGLLMLRQVMLDRALDIAVRDLRIGTWQEPTHDLVKRRICDAALMIPDCEDTVLLELREISTATWDLPATDATCVDRPAELNPMANMPDFRQGGGDALMLVRACAVFDPIFPGAGLGLDLVGDRDGNYALVSASVFVNEPR